MLVMSRYRTWNSLYHPAALRYTLSDVTPGAQRSRYHQEALRRTLSDVTPGAQRSRYHRAALRRTLSDVTSGSTDAAYCSCIAGSELLYHVNVTVVPNKECSVTMPEKICTQGKNQQGICSGDSGGPLVIQDGTQYVQIGVVSFGTRCRTDAPNGYTRVSSFLKWIAQQTNIQLRL
uniref:Peptidase S1 domain-containing protein n=1 Tax=Timema cristinae TaxID=61476 RepID=A0A7R9D4J4_TIMCR|nr:unnamed protein product [Timema cristinae]